MDLATWQTNAHRRLAQLAQQINEWAPSTLYGALASMSLLPLVTSADPHAALTGIVSGVGANLLAEQLSAWQARYPDPTPSPDDEIDAHLALARQLTKAAQRDAELRTAIDQLLLQTAALQTVVDEAEEKRRPGLVATLNEQLSAVASALTLDLSASGGVTVVGGDQITGTVHPAAGSGNSPTAIGKNIQQDIRQIHTQQYVEKQEIHNPLPPSPALKGIDRYLKQLRVLCHALPMGALGGDEDTSEEISLDQVYIDLDTETRIPLTEAEQAARAKDNQLSTPGRDGEERTLTVLEAATQTRRLVLLGDPGGGKSTFVRQLVTWISAARLEQQAPPTGWPTDLLPLIMTLRDLTPHLAALDLAKMAEARRDQALVGVIRHQLQIDLQALSAIDLADSLEDALVDGRVLLVFDGLDEVPEHQRAVVRLAIRALLGTYRSIQRVIVTCRKRSYVGAAVLPSFTPHTLAAFDEAKIEGFVAAWYHAQVALGRMTVVKAEDNMVDLQRAALAQDLRELAGNPMLLTTMAIIHQRQVGLPKERARLYNLAVEVLLNRWQKRKDLLLSTALDTFLRDELKLRACMERLAYEAHRQKQQSEADLPRPTLLVLLEQKEYLGEVGLAAEFLDYVDERAGLLVGRGSEGEAHPPSYAFPHRTFQEYLAGCYLVSGRGIGRAYWRHAAEGDYWYLAAQLGAEELLYNRRSTQVLLDLMYDLSPERAPGDKQTWRAALWSGQMAVLLGADLIREDDGEPTGGANYLQRQIPRLRDLLRTSPLTALERAEAGRMLAKLGDPRRAVLDPWQMEFCSVPAGEFVMGEGKEQHLYNVPYPYWISRYPITNAQFNAFVDAGGYANEQYWLEAIAAGFWRAEGFGGRYDSEPRPGPVVLPEPYCLQNHPVVGVSWYEALAFTRWLTTQINDAKLSVPAWLVRLPNEPEWEKAARGGLKIPATSTVVALAALSTVPVSHGPLIDNPAPARAYAWLGEIDPEYVNYEKTQIGSTSAVGCFAGGVSPYGVEEMNGNVWEWTRSLYADYPYSTNVKERLEREDLMASDSQSRVLRGGAFRSLARVALCAERDPSNPSNRVSLVGFRVLVSPSALDSEPSGL